MGHPVESSIIKTSKQEKNGEKKRETFRGEIPPSFVWITTII